MKLINKDQMDKLIKQGYIQNTPEGYIDKKGYTVGFYRTRNKRYIEDKYADIAASLR